MYANNGSEVARIIQDYLDHQRQYFYYHNKKSDAEKEYNKLLATFGGEVKEFTLDQADKIFSAYREMQTNEEQSRMAEQKFSEADEKLKELGHILFYASIIANITIPPVNSGLPDTKHVTVTFPNGKVLVI